MPPTSKAVILARGLGTRMRAGDATAGLAPEQAAAADAGMKAMIPIGRPFLDYVLHALADAGIREVALVIGPEHDAIREYYGRPGLAHRLRVVFAIQERPIGTADAVLAAEPFVGDESFLVLNADNHYPADVLAALRALPAPALPGFGRQGLLRDGLIPPERIARYALLEVAPDAGALVLRRIVEKPDEATARRFGLDALVSMNVWLLTPAIFRACREVAPSPRGELELPLAVQHAVDAGMRFTVLPVDAPVLDLSHRADVAVVAARLRGTEVRL